MNFKDEWRLLAISDNMDDVEHRPMTEEYLFYQAVATGDVEAVRKIVNKSALSLKMVLELYHAILLQI